MPVITIADNHVITIDGRESGTVFDAVANDIRSNRGQLVADIKAAYDVWFIEQANLRRDAIADAQKELPTVRAEHAAILAEMKQEHAAQCAKLEADIAALGTKEEAQAIRKQQDIAKIKAQIAADTTRLAELSA